MDTVVPNAAVFLSLMAVDVAVSKIMMMMLKIVDNS